MINLCHLRAAHIIKLDKITINVVFIQITVFTVISTSKSISNTHFKVPKRKTEYLTELTVKFFLKIYFA